MGDHGGWHEKYFGGGDLFRFALHHLDGVDGSGLGNRQCGRNIRSGDH